MEALSTLECCRLCKRWVADSDVESRTQKSMLDRSPNHHPLDVLQIQVEAQRQYTETLYKYRSDCASRCKGPSLSGTLPAPLSEYM